MKSNKRIKHLINIIQSVLTCEEQYELVKSIASNIGYNLSREDERKNNSIEELALLILEASREAHPHNNI